MFRLILVLVITAFVGHRGYYNRKLPARTQETVVESDGGASSRLSGVFGAAALVSTLIYCLKPQVMRWSALSLPDWVRWGGVGLAASGFTLLQWSQNTLGRNWSDKPRLMHEQALVTEGPYRWVRHPIYTAFLMILGAPLLIAANWFVGGAWLGMTAIDVWARIRFEEAVLQGRFGAQYSRYVARTGRLFPKRG